MSYLNDLCSSWGLMGWKLDLVVSLLYGFFIVTAAIVIGHLINKLEQFQLQLLKETTGSKIAYFICNRVTFIGTVIHELSHALMVVATGAKLRKVKLFEISSDGTLGHVEFSLSGKKWKQMCQLSLISCAPVFTGVLLEYIFIKMVIIYHLGFWSELLLWYLIISILDHMSMSDVDIKNYLKGMIVVYPMLVTFIMFVQYFFVNKVV